LNGWYAEILSAPRRFYIILLQDNLTAKNKKVINGVGDIFIVIRLSFLFVGFLFRDGRGEILAERMCLYRGSVWNALHNMKGLFHRGGSKSISWLYLQGISAVCI